MRVYLDNAATTMTDPRAVKKMLPYYLGKYGNPSSLHAFGREAEEAVDEARETIAKALSAGPREIVFTGSGSEADNLALRGVLAASTKRSELVVSEIEHPAVLRTAEALERAGVKVKRVGVDGDGMIDFGELEKAVSKRTALVSVMHANNEVGTVQPLQEIAGICRDAGALFHTDAVQSFGKIPVSAKHADLITVSSHKIHGPKGVGALFVREGVPLSPLITGGLHEFGKRAGTENVPGIVGFGEAVFLSQKYLKGNARKMTRLRDKLIRRALEIPDSWLNGHAKKRLPNNAHLGFDFVEGEALVLRLDARGVAASTGSACSSQSLEPSHVLLAMGLSHVKAHGSLRLTLSKFTTEKEVDYVVSVLPKTIAALRKISSLNAENASAYRTLTGVSK
ncbi:cysteine desulfurase NifS [Candidatus Micrarchaeota archaeon CG_4_10_14_0_2_um_filter_55_9]|nr:MAG: cysteine desulfurase NifS [Candidatus Micrarchaeota archaeon CG1_02_55_41]PIO02661.1 MAG: cysteine desulfurase NifS [Candidatus Micrarchaeota archaeon CG09_land_8_20_14_0_10_55_25]PIZ91873.1 MAG: cysteine desulfurase NifS [Candidatus Micrarchaeota archaeon CG_4_10_14_0_2_um_filter_55_9]PJD01225.1 MAG: cysteine desulfurase NifS [Candidatus Micrarchaeota archaeon CG10_big_fil_rev_8_21_14_0_10_54_18]